MNLTRRITHMCSNTALKGAVLWLPPETRSQSNHHCIPSGLRSTGGITRMMFAGPKISDTRTPRLQVSATLVLTIRRKYCTRESARFMTLHQNSFRTVYNTLQLQGRTCSRRHSCSKILNPKDQLLLHSSRTRSSLSCQTSQPWSTDLWDLQSPTCAIWRPIINTLNGLSTSRLRNTSWTAITRSISSWVLKMSRESPFGLLHQPM